MLPLEAHPKVAAVQMEPRIGEVDANLKSILARTPGGHRRRGATGRVPRVRPDRLRLRIEGRGHATTPSRSPGLATPARSPPPARRRGRSRDLSACWSATATGCSTPRPWWGRMGVVGTRIGRSTCRSSGIDRFADPGDRPFEVLVVDGLRVGHAHLLRRDVPRVGTGADPPGGRRPRLADQLADPVALTTAEHLPATRAIENVVYVMAVDRVGEERGFSFAGTSSIAGPGGEILARRPSLDDRGDPLRRGRPRPRPPQTAGPGAGPL